MRKCIGAMQQITLRHVSHGSMFISSKRCTSSRTASEFRRPILLPGTPVGGDILLPVAAIQFKKACRTSSRDRLFCFLPFLSAPGSASVV